MRSDVVRLLRNGTGRGKRCGKVDASAGTVHQQIILTNYRKDQSLVYLFLSLVATFAKFGGVFLSGSVQPADTPTSMSVERADCN